MLLSPYRFGVAPPTPMPQINKVWFYDASRGAALALGQEQNIQDELAQRGIIVTVVNKSVSGRNLPDTLTAFNAEKAAVKDDGGLLVISMPIGNSISGSWDSHTATWKADFIKSFSDFADAIVGNGNIALLTNTTYRLLGGGVNDEEAGSFAYNRAVIWPKIQNITSSWWNGLSRYNPYNQLRNWYTHFFAPADPVHSTIQGYQAERVLVVDCIEALVKGLPPPVIPRVEDPTLSQIAPQTPGIVMFVNTATLAKSSTNFWAIAVGQTWTGSGPLMAMQGYDPTRLGIKQLAAQDGSGNNAGGFNNGNRSKTLLHDACKNNYIFTQSTAWKELARFTGFTPGQLVDIDVLVARAGVAGQTNRIGEYTTNGGATVQQINAAIATGAQPVVTRLAVAVADSNGEIPLWGRATVTGGYCHLNAAIPWPRGS